MKKLMLLSMVIGAFALTACDEKVYTVEELKLDDALYNKVKKQCKNGEYKHDSQICENMRKVSMSKSYYVE